LEKVKIESLLLSDIVVEAEETSPPDAEKIETELKTKRRKGDIGIKRTEITYMVEAPSAEKLYDNEKDELAKLPLELFDSDEDDRSPEEWIAFGADIGGTPARSLFYINREWEW
jgi:hypothetical protein